MIHLNLTDDVREHARATYRQAVLANLLATYRQAHRRHQKRMLFIGTCLDLIARVRASGLPPTRANVVRRAQELENLDGWAEKTYITKTLKRRHVSFEKLLEFNKTADELTGDEIFELACNEGLGLYGGLATCKRRGPPKGSRYRKKT